ncbi:MAG: hypothetical protein JW860_04720 [Sedimentisphaerales bacterium]|nr:hypothetical protein [Sedimentisphaerales bacterium]
MLLSTVPLFANESRPRLIVTTDGEIDDKSSFVRFLLYTCDYNKTNHAQEVILRTDDNLLVLPGMD